MTFVETHPDYRELLEQAGLVRADDFLSRGGAPINCRADRQVRRVDLDETQSAYLKTESHVRLRDRWMSWRTGHGFASKSTREGRLLQALERAGVGCPVVMALGERPGQGFLLLKAENDLTPLDGYLLDRPNEVTAVLALLGRELAQMHEAGFYHPDLYPKHILVGRREGVYRFCIIDWQRTERLPQVSWARRILDLAVLDAALPTELIPERLRLRFLRSYLEASVGPRLGLVRFGDAVRSRSRLLLGRRRVRRQRVLCQNNTLAARPQDWQSRPNPIDRLANPILAPLPLLNFLRAPTDVNLRRRLLRQAGRLVRDLHETGYGLRESSLEDWVIEPTDGAAEIRPARLAGLRPTTTAADELAPPELAVLDLQAGADLSRTDRLRFLLGYLGTARSARRALIGRIFAVREPAS